MSTEHHDSFAHTTVLLPVADNYGVMAYSVFLFTLTIWFSRQWGEATACPYVQVGGSGYTY